MRGKMRAAIAAALLRSKQSIPHFYETIDIDVEDVSKLREGMNKTLEAEKIRLSLPRNLTPSQRRERAAWRRRIRRGLSEGTLVVLS